MVTVGGGGHPGDISVHPGRAEVYVGVPLPYCRHHKNIFQCNKTFSISSNKTGKLAGVEDIHVGLLVPLLSEHEDSGIDSGDEERGRRQYQLRGGDHIAETSSSEEDLIVVPPCARNNSTDMEDAWSDSVEAGMPLLPCHDNSKCCDTPSEQRYSADRSSPPLYEVELTASDEEDDASVLELVIPIQSSRHKRVTSSSPLKDALNFTKLFCTIICCFQN